MGAVLEILAQFSIKDVLDLSITIAAVIYTPKNDRDTGRGTIWFIHL